MSYAPSLQQRLAAEKAQQERYDRFVYGMSTEEVNASYERAHAKIMAQIAKAKPHIDASHTDMTRLKPSDVLRFGFVSMAASKYQGRGSPTPLSIAIDFVESNLAEARRRHRAGLDPNPFAEPAEDRVPL